MKRRTAPHVLAGSTSALALSSFCRFVRAAAVKELRLDYAYYSPPSLVVRRFGWLEEAFAKDGTSVTWVLSAGSNRALEYLNADAIDIGSSAGLAAVLAKANGNPIRTPCIFSRADRSCRSTYRRHDRATGDRRLSLRPDAVWSTR